MGAALSTFGGWLQAGLNTAVGAFKMIWEKFCSFFGGLTDLARELFGSLGFCFSYNRERSYVQNEPRRVEAGHDELRFCAAINRTQAEPLPRNSGQSEPLSMPRDPEKRKLKRDETRRTCDILIKAAGDLKKIMDEDEGHENMAETSQRLNDLYNSENGRNLRVLLENRPTVNPSLAY